MAERSTRTAAELAAKERQLIKMGQAALGLDDDTYRQMLGALCNGKTSSKALTWQERKTVLDHMVRAGFVIKGRNASRHDGRAWDQALPKLRAIWWSLAEVGAVQRPADQSACDAAIDAWAKRQLPGLDGLRFASVAQMQRLIEAAKQWARRVRAPSLDDRRQAESAMAGVDRSLD